MKAVTPKAHAFAGTLFRRLHQNGQSALCHMGEVRVRLVSLSKQPDRVRALVTARGELPRPGDIQPVTAGLAATMAGGKEQRPSVIVVGNKTPVGRDLSNRPLAHIVTGGLSGS